MQTMYVMCQKIRGIIDELMVVVDVQWPLQDVATISCMYYLPSSFFRYSSPLQLRSLAAACSGVMSRWGSAIISYL
jgi:hypothetical protein